MPLRFKTGECKFCGRYGLYKCRGLCKRCYGKPAAMKACPPQTPDEQPGDPMTAADLDALVAERMTCLPAWWNDPDPEDVEWTAWRRENDPHFREFKAWHDYRPRVAGVLRLRTARRRHKGE